MEYNYPTLNRNIINELTTIYEELSDLIEKQKFIQKHIEKIEEKHNLENIDMKNKYIEQDKKIDLIHNLFNVYKENSQPNYDKILSNLINMEKLKSFDKNLYDSYNNLCTFNNKHLEDSHKKLNELNNNIIFYQETLEKYNTEIIKKINIKDEKIKDFEIIINAMDQRIKNLENFIK
tara:strand:+ start:426 stop:956 length:531 start_codon:yes stop_codon:yes gene_type:complete